VTLIRLGEGVATSLGVSPKAALLDHLRHRGLTVPEGAIIADGSSSPTWLQLQLAGPVVVRSAFGAEDGSKSARAGQFHSVLHITEETYLRAYQEVLDSSSRVDGTFRTDILVMQQVLALHAGVGFSEHGWLDDVVNVTDGLADGLVSGEVEGQRFELSRFHQTNGEPTWHARLRVLLSQVREQLGDVNWDIEWADDGSTCWLVQVRPITVPLRRNEAFTSANHKEILPDLPSVFMTSVIESCEGQLFGWYRKFDGRLPNDRPFIEVFAGRPFLNLSLLEDMLRLWGLPSRLIADSFGGEAVHDEPFNRTRFIRSIGPLFRQGIAQLSAVTRPKSLRKDLPRLITSAGPSLSEQIESAKTAYVMMVTGMMPLSSFISGPVSILRKSGTLAFHAQRHETVSTRMARAKHAQLIGEFGHRGVYESDLARPRFADQHMAGQEALGSSTVQTKQKWSAKTIVTFPIWVIVRQAISARELHRHECMRAFHSVRQSLVRSAERCANAGQLRSADDLWLLQVHEVRKLDTGWQPDEAFWIEREAQQKRYARLDPPTVVHRFDNPVQWNSASVSGETSWSGIPLTNGRVRGAAWVLSEPSTDVPDGLTHPIVLIARSVDAGWVITFPLVDAVAVETGGDLSHGSIVLRELGKPAVTNVRNMMRGIATGDLVELDAQHGTLVKI
jgi:rifampicin phosphotransferase